MLIAPVWRVEAPSLQERIQEAAHRLMQRACELGDVLAVRRDHRVVMADRAHRVMQRDIVLGRRESETVRPSLRDPRVPRAEHRLAQHRTARQRERRTRNCGLSSRHDTRVQQGVCRARPTLFMGSNTSPEWRSAGARHHAPSLYDAGTIPRTSACLPRSQHLGSLLVWNERASLPRSQHLGSLLVCLPRSQHLGSLLVWGCLAVRCRSRRRPRY